MVVVLRDWYGSVFLPNNTTRNYTGRAPSEVLLGRRPSSRLDLLKPHKLSEHVEKKQEQQKLKHVQLLEFESSWLVILCGSRILDVVIVTSWKWSL